MDKSVKVSMNKFGDVSMDKSLKASMNKFGEVPMDKSVKVSMNEFMEVSIAWINQSVDGHKLSPLSAKNFLSIVNNTILVRSSMTNKSQGVDLIVGSFGSWGRENFKWSKTSELDTDYDRFKVLRRR